VDEPGFDKFVEDNLDVDQRSKVTAQYWDRTKQVVFWYPDSTNEIVKGIAINIESGALGFINSVRTATVPHRNAWEHDISFDVSGQIRCYGDGVDDGTAGVDFQLLSKKFDLGAPLSWKDVQALTVATKRFSGTVQVRVATYEDADDAAVWTTKQSIDDGLELLTFDGAEGRFFEIEITATAIGADIGVTGMEVYGALTGEQI
jgi:hypothetical protein